MITEINHYNLRANNTFRIDSTCDRWIEFSSADDLPAVASLLSGGRFVCIGAGSNMLFVGDYDGAVVHSRILDVEAFSDREQNSVRLRVGSGVEFDALIQQCCQSGLWGIENLSGIPGEVGAAAVQNVGAYGVEACDVIKEVECFDMKTLRFVTFQADECDYGYRHSMFKNPENHSRYIITYVTLELSTVPAPKTDYGSLKNRLGNEVESPLQVREAIINVRNEKLPSVDEIGSAGSFFKNPIVDKVTFEKIKSQAEKEKRGEVPHYKVDSGYKIPAAWLIDQCGLKGFVKGNAGVWHKQPLVIVNLTGKASSAEIIEIENIVINAVESTFGVRLSPEVEHICSK